MQRGMAIPHDDDWPEPPAEATLIQRARGDPTHFSPLYHRYRDRIYWYLRARVSGDEDAADLTQQVFLQALDRLHQYREQKGSFAAWLFAIARHAASNSHRRPRTVDWDYLPPAFHVTEDDPTEADAIRRESVTRVTHLVAGLPIQKRELIVLRYVGGLTIPEIAAIVGKSSEATRKDLHRTLQTLKERYDDPRT